MPSHALKISNGENRQVVLNGTGRLWGFLFLAERSAAEQCGRQTVSGETREPTTAEKCVAHSYFAAFITFLFVQVNSVRATSGFVHTLVYTAALIRHVV